MEVRTTRGQIEEFIDSILWKDMRREPTLWKTAFRREMETIVDEAADGNPSTAAVLMHMGDINGRIKAVDYLLEIPRVFLQILEDEAMDKAKEEDT